MDKTGVYSKTPRGLDEIDSRALKLAPKLRQVLIMVDGQSDVATLAERLETLGDVIGHLSALEELGLIATPRSAPSPARSSHSAAPPAADMAEIRRAISHMLVDSLGPDADMLALKIEKSPSREELIRHCETCRSILAGVLGEARSEAFWVRASRLLA